MANPAIVYGTDFSEHSEAALQFARRLAQETGRRLLVVHVDVPPGQSALAAAPVETAAVLPVTTPAGQADQPLGTEALQQKLEEIRAATTEAECEVLSLQGDPATELVRLAKEGDVGQVVVGSHGRTGLARLLMGSVAEAVVRHAPCPVTVVKSNVELRQD